MISNPTHYKSDVFAAIHESMEALHQIGAISKTTMREFDETCLTPIQPMSPEDIRALRKRENASQPVFARYLHVSSNQVSEWERGIKKPSGAAMRLLTIVYKKGLHAIS